MLTVLVIDNDLHLQIACQKVLTSSGYRVECASDGEGGLRRAIESKPDVIVLDMALPELGGMEVLRLFRQFDETRRIPVIALSSLPVSNVAKLKKDGTVNYLQKPALEDLDVLLQAIDYALVLPRDGESWGRPSASARAWPN